MAAGALRDQHHELCVQVMNDYRARGALVVPVTVTVEVDYLLRSRGGTSAARRFLADLKSGALQSEPVDDDVLSRACAIDLQYADVDLGIVDATVIAVAERLSADAILTLDHPHFRMVRELPCELRPTERELQSP